MNTVTIKKGKTEFTYEVKLAVTDSIGHPYTFTIEIEGDRNEYLQYAEPRLSEDTPDLIKQAQRKFVEIEEEIKYEARMARWCEAGR